MMKTWTTSETRLDVLSFLATNVSRPWKERDGGPAVAGLGLNTNLGAGTLVEYEEVCLSKASEERL